MLSKEDVPHLGTPATERIKIPLGFAEDFYIKINEISNEYEVHSVDISKRSCRFYDENDMDIYPVYSTSACLINCRKKLQLKLCNCTSHFMPNSGRLHMLCSGPRKCTCTTLGLLHVNNTCNQTIQNLQNKLNSVQFL